ncbi:MAG: thiol reductase thioredoxin [Phycisphaeraceae bacterium]|nr:thiol reductase thioredoxin [Phycisphaeraceae bacterium]
MLTDTSLLTQKFGEGLEYEDFVAIGEPEGHRPPWDQRYGQLELTPEQDQLIRSFTREMNVLCLTGTWCGDCALQGSAMARVAEANPGKIHLRYILRCDEHADLIVKSTINGGFRVPVTWFMAEDFEPVGWFGDRTLSRYRSMARKALPPSETIALAAAPEDPVRTVLDEVIEEFERVHLILRLSTRLRAKHGD